MNQTSRYHEWIGEKAYDAQGEELGEIKGLLVDEDTGRPEWLTVATGWFGMRESVVPIAGASPYDDGLMLGWDRDTIKDAPNVDADEALDRDEERRLYDHYGFDYEAGAQGYPTGERPDAEFESDALTLSEEQLRATKERQESGRVRLRKYVVTDEETMTVPVEREEVRIEREPIPADERSAAAADIGEDEREVVLHEEHATAHKETVPREQVHLEKERQADEEEVKADLRREEVDVDHRR